MDAFYPGRPAREFILCWPTGSLDFRAFTFSFLGRPGMHLPHRSLSIGLTVALVATGVATLVRLSLAPSTGGGAPFTIQLVAVVVTAWFGGFWPGLAATVLGYFVAEGLFVHPLHSAAGPMSEAQPAALVRFFSYAIVGIAISF